MRDEGPSLDPGDGGGGEGVQGREGDEDGGGGGPNFCIFVLLFFCPYFVFLYFCKVGREERVEVVVASYSGEMEQLLRQAVRDGQQGRAVSLLLGVYIGANTGAPNLMF